jgi:hypothetical protein
MDTKELTQVPEITVAQSGQQFLSDQQMMEDLLEQKIRLRKEIETLKTEHSLAVQACKDHIKQQKEKIELLVHHCSKLLNEVEGAYDSDEKFASDEFCRDYLDAALFLQNYFGRKYNRTAQAQEWINRLPY